MGQHAESVVSGVRELLLKDPLPTLVVTFDVVTVAVALPAVFGYLGMLACRLTLRAYQPSGCTRCPRMRHFQMGLVGFALNLLRGPRATGKLPRLRTLEERGNAGPELVLLDCHRSLSRFSPYDLARCDQPELNRVVQQDRPLDVHFNARIQSQGAIRPKQGASTADIHELSPTGFSRSSVADRKCNREADGLTRFGRISEILARPYRPVSRIGTTQIERCLYWHDVPFRSLRLRSHSHFRAMVLPTATVRLQGIGNGVSRMDCHGSFEAPNNPHGLVKEGPMQETCNIACHRGKEGVWLPSRATRFSQSC